MSSGFKSGLVQSIGGYLSSAISIIIGLFITPKLISAIGADVYGHYASWTVKASFLYAFFPSVGRRIVLEKTSKKESISLIKSGIIISLFISFIYFVFFAKSNLPILYLLIVAQFLIYTADQIRAFFQRFNLGVHNAISVLINKVIMLIICLYFYDTLNLKIFVYTVALTELISVSYLALKIKLFNDKHKIRLRSFLSILPYYFESNSSRALSESFLKNASFSIAPSAFGSISLFYRLTETVASFINIPLNAYSSYFLSNKTSNKNLNLISFALLCLFLVLFLIYYSFSIEILEYFNMEYFPDRNELLLIITAIYFMLLRPLSILNLKRMTDKSWPVYLVFCEFILFWSISFFSANAIIFSGGILYGFLTIYSLLKSDFRGIWSFFLFPFVLAIYALFLMGF